MAPVAAQTQLQLASNMQGETTSETTPMPLQREALEETPEALPADVSKSTVPPAPLRGLEKLPQLDLWDGEVPVKDTFIHFITATPGTRVTSKLCGATEPKDFKPSRVQEVESLESPGEIGMPDASVPERGARSGSSRVIQLNLDVWIPRTSTAAERVAAPPVRVAEHHFPVPSATRSEPTAPFVRLSEHLFPVANNAHDDASGEPVRRRLFHHNSV